MNTITDYSRQQEVFMPHEFGDKPVHVIGCGATGSWVAVILGKLGVKNIILHDFDEVEEHNIPNQLFTLNRIGEKKVVACSDTVYNMSGIETKIRDEKVDGDSALRGIVFMLTDTMKSRSDIYRKAIRNNFNVDLLIETRMGLEGGRIYCIDPKVKAHQEKYEDTLYSDDEAVVSACGVSQSLAATSAIMAGYAVWQLIKYHNKDEDFDNEVLLDARGNQLLARKF